MTTPKCLRSQQASKPTVNIVVHNKPSVHSHQAQQTAYQHLVCSW